MTVMVPQPEHSIHDFESCSNEKRKYANPRCFIAFVVFISFYTLSVGIFGLWKNSLWSEHLPDFKPLTDKSNGLRRNLQSVSPQQAEILKKFQLPTRDHKPTVVKSYKSMITNKELKQKCSTCAIVSTSGQMLNTKAGHRIDNASCVIRMNHAPTEHYKEDVGSRTTIRVICHMSTANIMAKAEGILSGDGAPEKVLFFGLNTDNHKWAKLNAYKLMKQFPDVDYYSLDKLGELNADILFEEETGKSKKKTNTWLSTGWYTFLVAIDMCEEIDVYGFVDENYCRIHPFKKTKYHYFQSWDNPDECDYYRSHENASLFGGHRFLTEKAVFSRWAYLYNITFHNPAWNISRTSEAPVVNTPWVRKEEEDKNLLFKLFQSFAQWAFGSMF